MVYRGTIVSCLDNSGALLLKCIKVYGRALNKRAQVGDLLLVSVQSYRPNRKVKKGDLFKAVLVRTKSKVKRYGNFYISANNNSVVLLDNRMLPLGSRILGTVFVELRKKYMFLISLAPSII